MGVQSESPGSRSCPEIASGPPVHRCKPAPQATATALTIGFRVGSNVDVSFGSDSTQMLG